MRLSTGYGCRWPTTSWFGTHAGVSLVREGRLRESWRSAERFVSISRVHLDETEVFAFGGPARDSEPVIRLALLLTSAAVLVAAADATGAPLGGHRVAVPQRSSAAPGARPLPKLEEAVINAVNDARSRYGLAPVQVHSVFGAAARAHSLSMARKGYFAHSTTTSMLWHAYAKHWSLGENLAWFSPAATAQQIVQFWLHNAAHRKVMLERRWRKIGVGVVHADAAPGVFGGRPVTVVTADFGVPA
jgi:uncharacterized protein YkwD